MFLEDLEKVWEIKDYPNSVKKAVLRTAGGIPKFHADTKILIFKSINKLVNPIPRYVSINKVFFCFVIRIYLREDCKEYRRGAVLVTLPGVREINQCCDYYSSVASKMKVKLRLLVLHSKIGQTSIE